MWPKRYDGAREALKGVSLEVATGELSRAARVCARAAVLKLRCIEHPTRGTVTVDSRNLHKDRDIPPLTGDRSAWFSRTTSCSTIAAPTELSPLIVDPQWGTGNRPAPCGLRWIRSVCSIVNATAASSRRDSTQRLGIARAIVSRPKVGTSARAGNLDPDLALEVVTLFKRLHEGGTTMVIATHDLQLVEHFGSRQITLSGGLVA